MRKLTVFNHVTLDGYFTDPKGDMSWAHKDPSDAEYASMWLVNRVSQKSDMAATHATTADLGPYWNELKAKRDIARLRLEKAYEGA